MLGLSFDLGIDLGTSNVRVYVRGRGIVIREPCVVAVDRETSRFLAVGDEARRMVGRTPGDVIAVRPIRDGVIANYTVATLLLRHFISTVARGKILTRPRVVISVPPGITSIEQRAVIHAAIEAGAKSVYMVEEPIAAAMGVGLDISGPEGNMVVDIGGGTTSMAILSFSGPVVTECIRLAGDRCDESIARFIKKHHNLIIGERTAEQVKLRIGSAYPEENGETIEVRGRDLATGLPRAIMISRWEIYEALSEPVGGIVSGIKWILEKTPPELASDIGERGMVLTGGGALLKGLDRLLKEETGIPAIVVENPMDCVALGTGKLLEIPGNGRLRWWTERILQGRAVRIFGG